MHERQQGIIYGKNKATSKAEIVLINPIRVQRFHRQTSNEFNTNPKTYFTFDFSNFENKFAGGRKTGTRGTLRYSKTSSQSWVDAIDS